MANDYVSQIDISLGQVPEVLDAELYQSLQDIYSTLQILASSVQPLYYTSKDIATSYTLSTDDQLLRVNATAGSVVITLPLASTCKGRRYTIKRTDASGNAVTLVPTSPELLDSSGSAITIASNTAVEVQAGLDYWDTV